MTVFSTPCWPSATHHDAVGAVGRLAPRIVLAHLLLLLALFMPASVYAGKIEPVEAALAPGEDAYLLSARFQMELGNHLEEAVSRGVPLYFVMEFDLTRNRWYWANEHVAGKTITYRLAYNALTRQYRVSAGGLHQNFATLEEALRAISRIGNLPVADKNLLRSGETYQAAVRLSLDRQQLPKPFQVDAIANRDWQVEAVTRRWTFVPTANVPALSPPAAGVSSANEAGK